MNKIVVATRCLNEENNIERFLRGYDFADLIVISDGGSTDASLDILSKSPKVEVVHFDKCETINGYKWNPDNPHIQHAIDEACKHDPLWLILDDIDCIPNGVLRESARKILERTPMPQMNVFRLYLWGDDQHFPFMNRNFDLDYVSLWAWKPRELDIHANPNFRHGSLIGMHSTPDWINIPACLLHKSWNPETIQKKVDRYNALGLPMQHPLDFAGKPEPLPEWAVE